MFETRVHTYISRCILKKWSRPASTSTRDKRSGSHKTKITSLECIDVYGCGFIMGYSKFPGLVNWHADTRFQRFDAIDSSIVAQPRGTAVVTENYTGTPSQGLLFYLHIPAVYFGATATSRYRNRYSADSYPAQNGDTCKPLQDTSDPFGLAY